MQQREHEVDVPLWYRSTNYHMDAQIFITFRVESRTGFLKVNIGEQRPRATRAWHEPGIHQSLTHGNVQQSLVSCL
jgi:hypothetical protein